MTENPGPCWTPFTFNAARQRLIICYPHGTVTLLVALGDRGGLSVALAVCLLSCPFSCLHDKNTLSLCHGSSLSRLAVSHLKWRFSRKLDQLNISMSFSISSIIHLRRPGLIIVGYFSRATRRDDNTWMCSTLWRYSLRVPSLLLILGQRQPAGCVLNPSRPRPFFFPASLCRFLAPITQEANN